MDEAFFKFLDNLFFISLGDIKTTLLFHISQVTRTYNFGDCSFIMKFLRRYLIVNFSKRLKLHFLVMLLYGLHCLIIFHVSLKGLLLSFSVHLHLDNSVSCLLFWCRKEAVRFL